MNNKKIQIWLPLYISLATIVGMFLGYKMRDNMPGKSFFYTEKKRPIQEIMDLIQNKYVDDVSANNLSDTAIQAILGKLDPHSVFIPAEEVQSINEDLAGNFFGIGVEYNIFNDTLNVINVLKDGPSDKAGLQTGDKFLKIDDSIVVNKKWGSDKFKNLIKGTKGTKVNITILRGNEIKQINIIRNSIPLNSLDASYMIDAKTGYIKLNKFSATTYKEFMTALMDLKKQGLQKLILDLRGNGGGLLDEAVEIADEFLSGDKLITYTEGKHFAKKEYRCRREGQFENGQLVVLGDEGTASASEILMGALQDWDRATIVGRRTFGKGLVQEQFDLSDHSALRLTIARYYTPIGRSIQRNYNQGGKAYYAEIKNRFTDGETQFADSVKNDTTKIFKTKNGKTVYGGGGISPDYFVVLDTIKNYKLVSQLYYKKSVPNFAYWYYLQNINTFKTFKSSNDFVENFKPNNTIWQQFITATAKDSITLNAISENEKENILLQIKSSIANIIWRNQGMYQTLNSDDKTIKKALEIIEK